MAKHYLGADIGLYNNLKKAEDTIIKYKGNLIQIFIIPLKKYKTIYDKFKFKNIKVVVHSSYLNNLCNNWDKYSWWIKNLEEEIKLSSKIGAESIVIHFGKRKNLTIQQAYNNMFTSLLYIHTITDKYKINLLLETSTGQGSEICSNLDELKYFYDKIKNSNNKSFKDRVKICIDTCHVFSAGYNLRGKDNIKSFLKLFDSKIGLNNVKLIHLNDSKVDMGSKVDRHASLGKGFIGIENINYLYEQFKKLNIPIILETPNDSYKKEIKNLLFSL